MDGEFALLRYGHMLVGDTFMQHYLFRSGRRLWESSRVGAEPSEYI